MKILKTKWYWVRRLVNRRIELHSGPYDGQKAAFAAGGPGLYGVDIIRGRDILEYGEDAIVDLSQPGSAIFHATGPMEKK